jgi:hypothetical protein
MAERVLAPDQEWIPQQDSVQAHYSSLTLHFGSWWSAIRAAEALERGREYGSLRQKPRSFRSTDGGPEFDMRTVTKADVLAAADAWWAAQPLEVQAEWDIRLGEGLPQRLRTTFTRWWDQWAAERKRTGSCRA